MYLKHSTTDIDAKEVILSARDMSFSNPTKVAIICTTVIVPIVLLLLILICYCRYSKRGSRSPPFYHEEFLAANNVRREEQVHGVSPDKLWKPTELESTLAWREQNVASSPRWLGEIPVDEEIRRHSNPQFPNPVLHAPEKREVQVDGENEAKFKCPELDCEMAFEKKFELNHHMRYHNKPEHCPSCEKSFGTVTHLNRHSNDVHNTTRKYYCSVEGCDYSRTSPKRKSFARRDNLRRHVRNAHRDNREAIQEAET